MPLILQLVFIVGFWSTLWFPAVAKSSEPPHLVFLVSGGFASCQDRLHGKMYSYLHPELELVRRKYKVPITLILTCFTGSYSHPKLEAEELFVSWLPENGQNFWGPEKKHVASFPSFLKSLIQKPGDSYLFMVGHSHGGWLVMNTVLELSHPYHFKRLITLDPISLSRLTSSVYRDEMVGALFGRNQLSEGEHTKAPSDLLGQSSTIRSLVQGNSGNDGLWINYYQVQFSPMHSGFIPQAHRNEQRAFPDGDSFLNHGLSSAHNAVGTSKLVWDEIIANFHRAITEIVDPETAPNSMRSPYSR